jgi:plasmid stabilization system protein ParE
MKPHEFHPEASREYEEAAEYYANIALRLGVRFHDEIERLILEVRRHPTRHFRFSPPAQRALSREFPYSVVYLDQPDRVWIVAVMHSKRRPGYWRHRVST